MKYLKELGWRETVMGEYPNQLSGGMGQRVTMALAKILWKRLIFADETTTEHDVVVQGTLLGLSPNV